jgi:hypothetical protein
MPADLSVIHAKAESTYLLPVTCYLLSVAHGGALWLLNKDGVSPFLG